MGPAEPNTELAIPWADLKPISPADGAFRFALAANGPAGRAEWGDGIRMGKTPDGFRLCRFGAAGAAEVAAAVVPLPKAPAAGPERCPGRGWRQQVL